MVAVLETCVAFLLFFALIQKSILNFHHEPPFGRWSAPVHSFITIQVLNRLLISNMVQRILTDIQRALGAMDELLPGTEDKVTFSRALSHLIMRLKHKCGPATARKAYLRRHLLCTSSPDFGCEGESRPTWTRFETRQCFQNRLGNDPSPLQNVNIPDGILHRVTNSSSQMLGIDDLLAWTD